MTDAELARNLRERQQSIRPRRPIEPMRTAAIVIDLQNFFLDPASPVAAAGGLATIPKVNAVAGALRRAGGPVVWTQHTFAPVENDARRRPPREAPSGILAELHQRLQPGTREFALHDGLDIAAEDLVVVKRRPSVFHPYALTDLEESLSARGIDTLIIMGVVTNGCCECTARDAYQLNYRVVFVSDANAAMTRAEHDATLFNPGALFAEVQDSDATLAMLFEAADA